jgi:hypothetical protein
MLWKLAFVIFGLFNFLALLSVLLHAVALLKFVVLLKHTHRILLIYFVHKSNGSH